ncbi:unnamed protein product, partial [Vitis vinifera]
MDIRVSLRRPSRLLFHTFFLLHLEGWFENPPSNTTAAAFLYGSPLMNLYVVGEQDNSRRLVLGTAKECLYTPGMSRKPRACIEDTWSFKNYTDTL